VSSGFDRQVFDRLAFVEDSDFALAQECRSHLGKLIREAWAILEPATPFVDGWHIDCVAEHLQAVTAGEIRRLIINQPPRTMKSLTTAVFWPAWEWLSAPHMRWLFASYAQDFAWRDSLKMRRLIKSRGGREDGTLFQRLGYQGVLALLEDEPWELTKDQDAKSRYETTATGMRLATSVGGMATGEGGNRIVVDDPVNAKQARSDAERVAANVWWDETMTTRFNNDAAAAVIVMQRLHEDDLTGHLLEQGGWHHLCLPATYEPSHPFVYPAQHELPSGRVLPGDPRVEEGELLDPVRLGPERLAELRRGLGSYGYAGQEQQRPAPAEGGMFKRAWWRRWQPDALPPQWSSVIASWDLAFKDTDGTSFVVGQVWASDGADRYLLGQVRARLDFVKTCAAIVAVANWRPDARAKLVEDKANGPAVISALQKRVTGLIAVQPDGSKEARAAAVSPLVEAGNVYLPADEFIPCPAGYEATATADFIEEHANFPASAHNDMVDATSQALNWLETRGGKGWSTQSYMQTYRAEPVVQRGGLTLVGERYLDREPGGRRVPPPGARRRGEH
jgi:predicted phage terminase large subunit-like protein